MLKKGICRQTGNAIKITYGMYDTISKEKTKNRLISKLPQKLVPQRGCAKPLAKKRQEAEPPWQYPIATMYCSPDN